MPRCLRHTLLLRCSHRWTAKRCTRRVHRVQTILKGCSLIGSGTLCACWGSRPGYAVSVLPPRGPRNRKIEPRLVHLAPIPSITDMMHPRGPFSKRARTDNIPKQSRAAHPVQRARTSREPILRPSGHTRHKRSIRTREYCKAQIKGSYSLRTEPAQAMSSSHCFG